MSNYRRLISYIYAYEGEVKGKNIGFAKLESRNGQCKLNVNVKKVYMGSSDLGVYLLSPGKEIYLGSIFIRSGAGEFRTVVSVDNAADSGCTMDRCYGLTLHEKDDTWRSYTTIWEDAVAHAAELELAEVTSEKAGDTDAQLHKRLEELNQEIGEAVSNREEKKKQEKTEAPISQPVPEAPMPVELPGQQEKEPEPMVCPPVSPGQIPQPPVRMSRPFSGVSAPLEIRTGVSVALPRAAVIPGTEQIPETAPPECPQPESAPPEQPQPEAAPPEHPQPEIPQPEPAPPECPQPESAPPEQPQPETAPSEQPEIHQPEPASPEQPEIPQPDPSPGESGLFRSDEQEEPFVLGDPEELRRLEQEEEAVGNSLRLWNMFRKRYPKIQAFDSAGGCEILTIKPQDIGLLPREIWNYGNNSFLLHGYYNYRYLILARVGDEKQGRIRYILGVPGHYYSNEKYMASMFGFPHFVLSKKQPSQDGRFGYWYTDIRMDNQD